MDPERVVGIDFSAAKSDAGRRTWIAEATAKRKTLELTALSDASAHLDCGASRERTLDALVEYVTGLDEPTAVGLDFPFSLPAELVGDDWHAFVDGTPDAWGTLGEIDSPRALYDAARARGEEGASLRRKTDERHDAQDPTGFRIKTQTYYGISRVLRGVHGKVAVAPFDDVDGRTAVVEAYPASLFGQLKEAKRTGYKRDTRAGVGTRRRNVEALRKRNVEFGEHREFAIATDDALDAVAAATAAWRAAKRAFETDGDDADATEGHIYA